MASDIPRPNPDQDHLDRVDDDDQEEMRADACDYIDDEVQKRLWVRTIIPLLQLRSHDTDPSGRVQLAFDLMHISACDAVGRILAHVSPRDLNL
jgi:hypothetical protein